MNNTESTTRPHPDQPAPVSFWRRLRRSIHIPYAHKLALGIGVIMAVCIGLLASIIIQHQSEMLRANLDDLATILADQIAQSAAEPLLADDKLALRVMLNNLISTTDVLGIAVFAADGTPVAEAGIVPRKGNPAWPADRPPPDPVRLHILEWQQHSSRSWSSRSFVTFGRPIRFQGVVAGHVLMTLGRSTFERAVKGADRSMIGATLIVIALGTLLTILLSRKLSRPIYQLLDAEQNLARGAYDDLPFPTERNDEIGTLMCAFNRFAEGLQERDRVTENLSRYLSPKLADRILKGEHRPSLGGERVDASVIFADIVGFTGMAEGMTPEEVAELLNHYFAHIARACEAFHGSVDKYIGDCAMLVFGVPASDQNHCLNAISCALAMTRLIDRENAERKARNLTPVHFRLGLNSGSMLAGNLGADERMEFTVIGDAVNLASRLCSASEQGRILIPGSVYERPGIADRVIAVPHRSIRLRGISHPVPTYIVRGLRPEYSDGLDRTVDQLWWRRHQRSA